MSVEFLDLLDERATILRSAVAVSPSGVSRKTWPTTVATNVPTSVQSASGRLIQNDAGQQIAASFKAEFQPEDDIVVGDRIVVSGVTYDVLLVYTVTSLLPHLEVYLRVATPGVA